MSEIITVSPLCHCIFCPIDIEFREESHIRNCLRSVETILGVFTWKNLRLLSNTLVSHHHHKHTLPWIYSFMFNFNL